MRTIDQPCDAPSNYSVVPVEVKIAHSFNHRTWEGAYTLEFVNDHRRESKLMAARSGDEVLLTAIARVLGELVRFGSVRISSTNEGIIQDLDGVQIWRWERAGWAKKNGDRLENWKLYARIAAAMRGRLILFDCDRDSDIMADASARNRSIRKYGLDQRGGK